MIVLRKRQSSTGSTKLLNIFIPVTVTVTLAVLERGCVESLSVAVISSEYTDVVSASSLDATLRTPSSVMENPVPVFPKE